jgi:hypothetical protein
MRGKQAKALRRLAGVDKKREPTKYYHYNAEKARKNVRADSSDPIIADTKRSIYQTAKKYFKMGFTLPFIRRVLSDAATERMNSGKA